MRALAFLVIAFLVIGLVLAAPGVAAAAPEPGVRTTKKSPAVRKRHAARPPLRRRAPPWGFLPGYRPPEAIEDERRARYYATGQTGGPYYAVPVARFYRGRWNGGGFGPCYTYTPIGPIWNCGR